MKSGREGEEEEQVKNGGRREDIAVGGAVADLCGLLTLVPRRVLNLKRAPQGEPLS